MNAAAEHKATEQDPNARGISVPRRALLKALAWLPAAVGSGAVASQSATAIEQPKARQALAAGTVCRVVGLISGPVSWEWIGGGKIDDRAAFNGLLVTVVPMEPYGKTELDGDVSVYADWFKDHEALRYCGGMLFPRQNLIAEGTQ